LQPLVIEGSQPGGQLTTTAEVENWPGESMILGPALMQKMRDQAQHFGARLISDDITEINLRAAPFGCTTTGGPVYRGACAILATGAKARVGWGYPARICTADTASRRARPVTVSF